MGLGGGSHTAVEGTKKKEKSRGLGGGSHPAAGGRK